MISSRNNPAIKQMRALRQRKERDATGMFFIEGIRVVAEAVHTGAALESLVVAPELLSSRFGRELVAEQQAAGLAVLEVTADVFASLSSKDGPQGLAAVGRQRWSQLGDLRAEDGLCWVALNAVGDPGNLGTILRTSDAVGGAGVILLGDCTDPFDPAAARASMGALFTQRLVKASWADFAAWRAANPPGAGGWAVVGAADSAATHYRRHAYPRPLILLMGSEREGLSADQQALCDTMVSIPMRGQADSLNLAVASAVLLYEILDRSGIDR